MFPQIWRIPWLDFPINSYGFMIMIGFLLAVWIGLRRVRREKWAIRLDDKRSNAAVVNELVRRNLISQQTLDKVQAQCEQERQAFTADVFVAKEQLSADELSKVKGELATVAAADFGLDLAILCMIFGLLGGKLAYVLQMPTEFDDPVRGSGYKIFDVTDGGLHPGGALLGVLPFAAWWWVRRRRQVRLDARQVVWITIVTLIFAFVGVRSLWLYQHKDEYSWKLLSSWQSGFVLYGGLIAAILAGILYALLRRQPILKFGDLAAPSIMVGVAFGRLGCFLNGCCFGKETDLPWGIRFPQGSPGYITPPFKDQRSRDLISDLDQFTKPIHPTQLYETIACVVIFFILSWMLRKKLRPGTVLLTSGVLYSAWRIYVETLRGDPGREMGLWGLTFSQTVGVFVGAACLLGVALLRTRKPLPESAQKS